VGYLGEKVIARVNGWKRNPTIEQTAKGLFDCEDLEDGRKIEVKSRSGWNREEIPVKKGADLAMLLYYYVNDKEKHCFQVVKSFDRSYLESHRWSIFIKEKLWEACLKDKLIRDL
jgi:hypothetical protein